MSRAPQAIQSVEQQGVALFPLQPPTVISSVPARRRAPAVPCVLGSIEPAVNDLDLRPVLLAHEHHQLAAAEIAGHREKRAERTLAARLASGIWNMQFP